MQSTRPQVYRVCTRAPATATRNMSFFPRFVQSEFAPVFRLLDDYAAISHNRSSGPSASPRLRSFQPRFDVKESKDSYELQGELPGIDQKDLEVTFTDPQTLQIKGRTERHQEQGTPASQQQVESQPEQSEIVESQPEEFEIVESETSSYHKATVEDETTMSGANPDATPADTAVDTPAETLTQEVSQQQQPKTEKSRYWVSERSVGQFQRTFAFPRRVDQEKVVASLKNGILSVLVPKAAVPENKRINVE